MIQKILDIANISLFSDQKDDFIDEYFKILDSIHECYKIITNVPSILRRTNIYDFIVSKLE